MKHLFSCLLACASVTVASAQQAYLFDPTPARAAVAWPNQATPKVSKSAIGGDLQQLYRAAVGGLSTKRGAGPASAAALQAAFPLLSVQGSGGPATVLVRITAQDVAALRPALQARGFVLTAERANLHFLEGQLPVTQLAPGAAGLEALVPQGLLGVRPILKPRTNTGRVQNQADYVLESYRVRGAQAGYSGQGLRVGVMSDSYNSLGGASAGVASGDLPANVQVLQDLSAGQGTDEGRAMVELIHDIAPNAGVAFSSVYNGEADFADQLLSLADPTRGNCKIIVDDVSYFDEPMYQDGVVAQAVNEAANRLGISYFSAAGNNADASCEYVSPVFRAVGNGASGDADLDFGASFNGGATDTRQHFSIPRSGQLIVALQWSDPFYTRSGVRTDLDMFLIKTRANGVAMRGDTVAVSGDANILSQTPTEILGYTNTNDTDTEFDLVISRYRGTANPARVKYILYGSGITPTEYFTRSSTLTGHTAALGAMSVAAAPSYNRLAPESFTAKGQPIILFAADGTPLPVLSVRAKPDFTAIDGASTTFFSGQALPDPKDGYIFFGTSAAAPNAAAVAALLLQAEPSLTPAQVATRLKSTALDIGDAGFDALTGSGLINAYRAIYGSVVAARAPLTESFDAAGLGTAWDIQGRGPVRAIGRSDYGPASLPGHLVLDGFFPYATLTSAAGPIPRVAEATLRLDLSTAASGGYVLSFRHKKFTGETDQAMPASFTSNGTGSNSDGVAMSVDGGTTWYRVADLTGTNASTSYQLVSVNLNTLATANNLTLGSDVRIRFQRSGSGQVDSYYAVLQGGRAFDDVSVTGANVATAPVAQFNTATTGIICPGSTVQFRDASLFTPTSYQWSFPGGSPASSTDANPTVTYATAGTYGATLTVTNAAGTASRTLSNVVTVSSAVPVANFTARQAPLCPGGSITFTNTSTQCVSTLSWSFPGGSPASSTAANPTVTYAAAGTYVATLTATNANGSSTKTFTVQVQSATSTVPYTESLAGGIPSTWSVINPDNGITWATASNQLRKDGTRGTVVDMNFYDYASLNQRDTLQTPVFDLRSQSLAFLRFDVAYAAVATVPAANNDSLAVDVYAACSNTRLGRAYLKSAAGDLPTTLPRTTSYAPTSVTQWRTENVDLSAYLSRQVYLRFIAFNHRGNHLYLSNVAVANTVLATHGAVAESLDLQVYPNPAGSGQQLTLVLPATPGTATLRVIDALGRLVSQRTVALTAAAQLRNTQPAPSAAGLYTVLCQTADGQLYSRRFTID